MSAEPSLRKSSDAERKPAPWEPVGFILDGEDWEPGEVGFILKTDGKGVSLGDLRKAAAAPDLLDALKGVSDMLMARPDIAKALHAMMGPAEHAIFELARAAIAKAEGRSDD